MAALVLIDAHEGSLDRYEIGGSAFRKTHACTYGQAINFTKGVVESFRVNPPDKFSVDPGPRPTNPPAGNGILEKAA